MTDHAIKTLPRRFYSPEAFGGGPNWVWRYFCTPISFEVLAGEHVIIWTMHCSLPTSGGFGDGVGFGTITGSTLSPFDISLGAVVFNGMYEVEVTISGTLTFTPTVDDAGGGGTDAITLAAVRIPAASMDFLDCE